MKLMRVNDTLAFFCPGCKQTHSVQCGKGSGPRWEWNGSVDSPTFSPSVLVTGGHFVPGFQKDGCCWCTYDRDHPQESEELGFSCIRCHSFVRDGMIQFLSDSSHSLAGQAVPIPNWPYAMEQVDAGPERNDLKDVADLVRAVKSPGGKP